MAQGERIVIGLNSGTSADGVDAAAVAIKGRGEAMKVRCLGHVARAYPKALRERILAIMAPAATRTEELAALDVEIGREFAATGAKLIKRLSLRKVDFIGSHGQTICHLPPGRAGAKKNSVNATLQIGDPATIAAQLKTPVVSHFRQADMAVGGQGAPLVPWTDWILLRHSKRTRIIQNIGGIANMTYLPAGGGPESVIAFDTGPGNMLIDAFVSHFTNGKETFDRNGRRAAVGLREGSRDSLQAIRTYLKSHPFLSKLPPKSCGREEFGVPFMKLLLKRFGKLELSANGWISLVTTYTAVTIFMAWLRTHANATGRAKFRDVEFALCGGGARNSSLVGNLAAAADALGAGLQDHQFPTTADFGIPIEAKECVSFAVLAAARMDGVAANLPRVTGAKRRVVLGDISAG